GPLHVSNRGPTENVGREELPERLDAVEHPRRRRPLNGYLRGRDVHRVPLRSVPPLQGVDGEQDDGRARPRSARDLITRGKGEVHTGRRTEIRNEQLPER